MSSSPTVGVDVGGTFTDAVLMRGTAQPIAVKIPTTDPPHEGVVQAIQTACDRGDVEPGDIDRFNHGSTVATNALLERDGADTALITTTGFRDVLEIGRQDRPQLYDLAGSRPAPLVPRHRRLTVDERTPPPDHPDRVRRSVNEADLDAVVEAAGEAEAVAVCLLHSDIDPTNERAVVERLRDDLAVPVVGSFEVDQTVREFERTATTVASAYVTPVLSRYLDRLVAASNEMGLPEPAIMQSNGGIASTRRLTERAVAAVLSGPAAGVVGAARTAHRFLDDADGIITFDMGGTSADVSVVEGEQPTRRTETTIDGLPLRVPAVDVHTVGAGGGSIAWVDGGGALRVGPASAGADPGPACYGRDGDVPTVTDAAVVLGIIGPDRSLGGRLELDTEEARRVLADLAAEAGLPSASAAAAGTFRVATETMTQAIRHITVERGRDPRSDALVAFGGAGGMFATAIADRLDIETVVVPERAGLLSAVGLVVADERHDVAAGVHRPLDAVADELEATYEELESTAVARCGEPGEATINRSADLRYAGQSYELAVPIETPIDGDAVAASFHAAHERRRGYALDDRIDVIACRVEAVVPSAGEPVVTDAASGSVTGTRSVHVPPDEPGEFAIVENGPPTNTTGHPCIIERAHDTVVVPPGWEPVGSTSAAVLTRVSRP